jgi:peptidoglycan/xylan/chitin deacetylase (PgdA/CDA1 family)
MEILKEEENLIYPILSENTNKEKLEITKNSLFGYLKINPKEIPEYPEGKKFAIVLSHDVDAIKAPWGYYVHHLLTDFIPTSKCILKRKNPYNTIEKIVNIEKNYNAKSTFFFMANENDPTGKRYKIEDLENEIGFLVDEGFDIGLHGSYNAYNSYDMIVKEKKRLEKVAKIKIIGYRNHYLMFKIPETFYNLEKAGFKYDSTLGYANVVGFRGGSVYPYIPKWYNTTILEIPMNVMDGSLFSYMKLDLENAWKEVDRLMKITEKYGGVLTFNWHNYYFDGICWKEYEKLYLKILKEGNKRNAWITSCEDLYKWWKYDY